MEILVVVAAEEMVMVVAEEMMEMVSVEMVMVVMVSMLCRFRWVLVLAGVSNWNKTRI